MVRSRAVWKSFPNRLLKRPFDHPPGSLPGQKGGEIISEGNPHPSEEGPSNGLLPSAHPICHAGSEKVLLINREAERILGVSREPDDQLGRYEQAAVRESPDGHALSPDELPIRRALVNGETVRAEEVRLRRS